MIRRSRFLALYSGNEQIRAHVSHFAARWRFRAGKRGTRRVGMCPSTCPLGWWLTVVWWRGRLGRPHN